VVVLTLVYGSIKNIQGLGIPNTSPPENNESTMPVKSKLKTTNDLYLDLCNYFTKIKFGLQNRSKIQLNGLPLDPTGIWKRFTVRVEKQMEMMVDQQISIQDKVLKNSECRIQSLSKVDLCGLLMDPTKIKLLKEEPHIFQFSHEYLSLMQSKFCFLMVYHLLAVNMLWKLRQTKNPDEEKKKMIEFETATFTNNISSNNYINLYNFYSNESPTCLSKGFQMENLKMTIDVFKK
jgi:hypothetical protein